MHFRRIKPRPPVDEPVLEGDLPEAEPLRNAPPVGKEICYGMLPDVAAQLKWLPESQESSSSQASGYGKIHMKMRLELTPNYGMLFTPAEEAVAVLNNKSFQALYSSTTGKNLEYYHVDAWVLKTEWDAQVSQLKERSANSRKAVKMSVNLILYGPEDEECQNHIANTLGQSQTYLQEPHAGLSRSPYSNPQSLQISNANIDAEQMAQTWSVNFGDSAWDESDDEAAEVVQSDLTQLGDLITHIDTFFEKLPRHRGNNLVYRDTRFISQLFSHQQEAVNFMVSRESGSYHQAGYLWQAKPLDNGELWQVYQHIITGAKSRSGKDFLGGILADDMGLGKTLSTLTTVFVSMSNASDFANQRISRQGAENPAARTACKATVVIVPSELLLNTWATEIKRHFYPESMQYIKYHGQERSHLNTRLSQQDVILTTYGTVMADRRRGNSILHQIDWYRLVLDEAHTIRNWSTKQFDAVNSISSQIRWCLTGTPIQNSLDDLASLVRFVKMPIFEEPTIFRKHITQVRRRRGTPASHGDFENLRLILSAICLRRSRAIMPMHSYKVEDRRPCFQPHERQQYRQVELTCKRAISIRNKGQIDNVSYSKVMEALLRLRMFCNNGANAHARSHSAATPGLGPHSSPDEVLSFLQQGGEAICAFCAVDVLSVGRASDLDSGYLTPCWRLVCGECTPRHMHEKGNSSHGEYSCDLCSSTHYIPESDQEASTIPSSAAPRQYPSKIQCLVDDVQAHYQGLKCVVFSFWKTTLDVVSDALEARGIKNLRMDGDMTSRKRNSTLLDFQNKSTWRVLIMTFSTGSTGEAACSQVTSRLNGLTVANRVHILEPQWNPAVENQAIGRVLRLDQQREVTVVRYAVQKSIEEVVQSRQLRKLQLAGGGFSQAERQEQKATQLRQLEEYFNSGSSA